MFSKTFGYALRAVTYIAAQSRNGQKVGLMDISERLNIPRHFLGKVMQDLVKHGVINSTKGPKGGFYSNDKTESTPLMDILKITDGIMVFETCALGAARCNAAHPCPLHDDFSICRDGLLRTFTQKNIGMIADEASIGHVFLEC